MNEHDPASNFFPDGEVDLYGALGLDSSAGPEAIKKAYRKLALQHHPDKSNSPSSHSRFQQIGFAYSILSSPSRKKRYDATGKTDELRFGLGEDGEGMDWDEYFATLWEGEVTGDKLREFKQGYQGSEEEKKDILEAYRAKEGDLQDILNEVPCLEVLADEQRVIDLINNALQSGELQPSPAWQRWVKNEKGRKRMREEAKREASEAEEAARELGVWEELFGSGKRGERRKARAKEGEAQGDGAGHEDDHEEEDDVEEEERERPAASGSRKRQKGNGSSASSTGSKSKKGKERKGRPAQGAEEEEEERGDISGLEALIAARQKQRSAGFDDVISRIEARASGNKKQARGEGSAQTTTKKKGGSSATKGNATASSGKKTAKPRELPEDPLDDAEFERLQATLFKDKDKSKLGKSKAVKTR